MLSPSYQGLCIYDSKSKLMTDPKPCSIGAPTLSRLEALRVGRVGYQVLDISPSEIRAKGVEEHKIIGSYCVENASLLVACMQRARTK